MSGDVFTLLPAATLLRAAPGTPLAATPAGQTVHVLNRPGGAPLCGRAPRKLAGVPAAQLAPPMRVCTLCGRRLPAAVRALLGGLGRPTREELAAVHEYAARQTAQQCMDRLAEIRTQATLDGTAQMPVELMVAVPKHPGPVPTRRYRRDQIDSGHVAGGQRMTLVQLINRLTPCGFVPGERVFVTGAPALGARVDVAPPRAAGGAR
ncbi:hypothetical protein [Blastococcus sp. CCUG 61487]|uniref:hypothetical protein n=1 Tax=Blastococcus sp. CCUG 61487 TaxID=1840703 RepID=UPI0010C14FFC|nr:hypothetical protein [Blastococcus sp. CCUG 61487]